MTRTVTLYGFGSAFSDVKTAKDVDLLIVHSGTDPKSCRFAIDCKQLLIESVASLHITMLATIEEAYFQFIKKAQAVCLGTVREGNLDDDLAALINVLPRLGA